jgi:hypothetical protein
MADRPEAILTGYEALVGGRFRSQEELKHAAPLSSRSVSPRCISTKFVKEIHGCSGKTGPQRSKRGLALDGADQRKPRTLVRSSSPRTERMFSTSPELIMEIDGEVWRQSPAAATSSLPSVLNPSGIIYVDETAARAALFPQPTQSPTPLGPGSTGQSALTHSYGPESAPSHSRTKTRPRAGSRSPTPSQRVLQYEEISPLIRLRTPPSIHSTPLLLAEQEEQRVYTQRELDEVASKWRTAGAIGIQNTRDRAREVLERGGEYFERKAAHDVAAAIAETRDDLTHEYVHELQSREQQMSNEA